MRIAIPLFDRFTALDAVGPYEVLSRLPGAEVVFVAERPGVVRTDTGALGVAVDRSLDDVERCDVVVVPGGPGTRAMLDPGPLHRWLTRIDQRTAWTTSVCTGSLILGAAGLLDGLDATTHWSARELLARLGARPVEQRFVVQGKVVTAAGVSAGIDMALWLAGRIAGDRVAQAIQLGIEYDPAPPYTAGTPHTAPPEVVELVSQLSTDRGDRAGT
ncbi:MAG: DJ-1/PfpI family protein [Acidimicrobiia bacterium]